MQRITAAEGAIVPNPPICGNMHFTRRRTDVTGVMHPHTRFGAYQPNFMGIHAAQCRYIQRKLRGLFIVSRFFFNLLVRGIHNIAPGGYFQVLRM
nr:hypothetical protein [Photorhabdus stackebrandtii]